MNMDLMKMLGQLKESQRKIEDVKERLSNEYLTESSVNQLLTVKVSKNGRLKDLQIDDNLLEDKDELIDYLILTLNKALDKAQNEYDAELEKVAKDGMPNIPGLGF